MADTAVQTIADFISTNRITMTCKRTDSNPSMEPTSRGSMDHWKCTLQRPRNRQEVDTGKGIAVVFSGHLSMTLTFSMGYGHHGAEPDVASVLDCIASDAAGVANAQSFEDWCGDYGYDADSRKAEKTYKACEHQAARLQAFLGDLYNTLLWHTERE